MSSDLALTLTVEQLRALVREELARALGSLRPDVLSVQQAADYAEVGPGTIRTWIREGLPATRRGRRLMLRREEVDQWRAGAGRSATSVQAIVRAIR